MAAALPELPYACGLATASALVHDAVVDPLVAVDGAVPVRDVTVRAAAVDHLCEAYALRVEHEGRALVFSGDTGPCPGLVELARGADVLLCESSWPHVTDRWTEPPTGVHLSARQAGEREVRTYRLASVLELMPGRATFRRPAGFELARYWAEASARFEAELRPLQAQVWVSARARGWLVHARSPFEELPVPAGGRAGWHLVRLAVESVEHGARQVLGLGGEAEVVEPAALRERVAALAGQIQRAHRTRRRRASAA